MDFMVDADMLKELNTLAASTSGDDSVRQAAREALMEILVALRDEAICQQNEDDED